VSESGGNMKKKSLVFLSAAAALTLAACGSANKSNTSSEASKASSKSKFNAEVTHEGTPIKGGTLKYALVAASPFSGIFIDELSSNTTDSTIASQVDQSMFEYDENRKLTNTGLASIELDVEGQTDNHLQSMTISSLSKRSVTKITQVLVTTTVTQTS